MSLVSVTFGNFFAFIFYWFIEWCTYRIWKLIDKKQQKLRFSICSEIGNYSTPTPPNFVNWQIIFFLDEQTNIKLNTQIKLQDKQNEIVYGIMI